MSKRGKERLAPVFAAADEDDLDQLLDWCVFQKRVSRRMSDTHACLCPATAHSLKTTPGSRDSRNRDGWTPLHQAAYAGSDACLKALLAAGAKPSVKCNDGCSPAHYASAQGHAGVLKLLAESGADLEAVDNDGESVLDVADGARTKVVLRKLIEAANVEVEEDEDEWEEEADGVDGVADVLADAVKAVKLADAAPADKQAAVKGKRK